MRSVVLAIIVLVSFLLGVGIWQLIDDVRFLHAGSSFVKSIYVKNPGDDHAVYFRLKVDVAYKGDPITFDIVVGCRVSITTYKDNDRTVEVGVAPMLFGIKMRDGRGVVVRPPEACNGETTEDGRVPSNLMPLIVTYENADAPWFGIAYASEDAYKSPASELSFLGATISRATREEWQQWRRSEAPKNFVTYDLLGINAKNPWEHPRWKPGYRAMGSICAGFSRVKLPESVKQAIHPYWPASRPDFWYPNEDVQRAFYTAGDYQGKKILFEGSPLREYFSLETNFFPGLPRRSPGAVIGFAGHVVGELYPASSDLSFNGLDGAGQLPTEIKAMSRKSYSDVSIRPDLKGFAFCDVVWNIDGLPAEISSNSNPTANRINGQIINEDLQRHTGDFAYAFERDEYVHFKMTYSLSNIFGGL